MEGKNSLVMIYGVNPVREALKLKGVVTELLVDSERLERLGEIIELAKEQRVKVRTASRADIDKLTGGLHQGVVAKIRVKRALTIDEVLRGLEKSGASAQILISDLIEDPQNFGAMLRVAHAAGVHAVVYQRRRSCGLTPSVWKASSGAALYINFVEVSNIKHAIFELKEAGIKVYGAHAGGNLVYWKAPLTEPFALVMGSESKGIRETVIRLCDDLIKIPMKGVINSLNVSTATAVILFEALRQRSLIFEEFSE